MHYFHQADDPYSHLAIQTVERLRARYRIDLIPHLVPPPDDDAAPERERLKAYGRRDAARVARRFGLSFPEGASGLEPSRVAAANRALAAALKGDFAGEAVTISEALWRGQALPSVQSEAEAALESGRALRTQLGHYLGGMFYCDGEWYWGVDRLHHLEHRLTGEGLLREASLPLVAPFQDMVLDGTARPGVRPKIEFWFSFRSPYSWIAAPRLHHLAAHYGAEVEWRFILPMVMRGLPVPRIKSRYIMLDVAREAAMVDLPFGTAVDPRGAGIERALAVLHRAIQSGRGAAFAESGLKAAFADGIDMARDGGLFRVAARAGLTQADVRNALADQSWRPLAEANRKALLDAGLWGAPTYRVNGGDAHWGQDRLWTLEEDLKAVTAASAPTATDR